MNTPDPDDSTAPAETEVPHASVAADHDAALAASEAAHPDPITGEAGAHPVGVGVGALGAGMAGAAIGALGGPIGMLVGAAIGAVAGGIAGKEVATASDEPPTSTVDEPVLSSENAEPLPLTGTPGESFESATHSPLSAPGDSHFTAASVGAFAAMPIAMESNLDTDKMDTDADLSAREPSPGRSVERCLRALSSDASEETIRLSAYHHYLGRLRHGRSRRRVERLAGGGEGSWPSLMDATAGAAVPSLTFPW